METAASPPRLPACLPAHLPLPCRLPSSLTHKDDTVARVDKVLRCQQNHISLMGVWGRRRAQAGREARQRGPPSSATCQAPGATRTPVHHLVMKR